MNTEYKTRENVIVKCLDYQIPVTQLKEARGRCRYTSSKARL